MAATGTFLTCKSKVTKMRQDAAGEVFCRGSGGLSRSQSGLGHRRGLRGKGDVVRSRIVIIL